jgi:hypothetical protein
MGITVKKLLAILASVLVLSLAQPALATTVANLAITTAVSAQVTNPLIISKMA